MSQQQVAALKKRCSSILSSYAEFDDELVNLCKVLQRI
jgi:hypothetical protein